MSSPGRILVLGAGPTGLGAAYRLAELGHRELLLCEARDEPGGLAASAVDAAGFTWDVGGHVQFSHYAYYDAVLDRALGDGWLHHERRAGVWLDGELVPYPLQHNLHLLAPAARDRALAGLEEAAASPPSHPPSSFDAWVLAHFGSGLADLFFVPYNEKVWGYPLGALGCSWVGERVALPDLAALRREIADPSRARIARADWGPNRSFRFPARGGTGAIWRGVAALLPAATLRFGARAARVELGRRRLVLASGERLDYDTLISTLPLDTLAALCDAPPAALAEAGARLLHSSVHVVGVGLCGRLPDRLARLGWMYFPGAESPYYRVTVFSNYSPAHVPPGGGHWSLMAEVCESPRRPVDVRALAERVVASLRRDGLVEPGHEVVSLWHRREEHGYPTPFLGRDAVVDPALDALASCGVYSRGRFGAWKYEVSNQDHSFMQGVELAERLLVGGEEPTLYDPAKVNRGVYLVDDARLASSASSRGSGRA